MTEKKAKLSRRNFLLTVGAGGAATAAAAIVAKSPTTANFLLRPMTSVRRAAMHADAEHVNNYYRTAKV